MLYRELNDTKLHLYYGKTGWFLSHTIGSMNAEVYSKTVDCPQIGGAFDGGLPMWGVNDFETCAKHCQEDTGCNFWQWNNNSLVCHITEHIHGYKDEANTYSGPKNCPATGEFESLLTMCPEQAATSNMWTFHTGFLDHNVMLSSKHLKLTRIGMHSPRYFGQT